MIGQISTLLTNLVSLIMEMSHLTLKLKALKFKLIDYLIVHLVLNFPPTKFDQFKVSYNSKRRYTPLMSLSYIVYKKKKG